MFINSFNKLVSGHIHSGVVNPSWQQVEAALRSMDANPVDGVTLNSASNSYMGVSGGNGGNYIVAGYLEGYGSFICSSGLSQPEEKQVVVSGDEVLFPSKQVISLDTALAAAREFVERGGLANELSWEKQR